MRTICFAMFGVYALVFGGFAGGVLLGAVSDAVGFLHGPTVALTLIGPVCVLGGVMLLVGSRYVRRDITMVIEDVLERHAEGQRRKAGESHPGVAGAQPRRLLRRQPGALRRRLRGGRGEIVALLGTNGAGKSHPPAHGGRARAPPSGGDPDLQGTTCTYLEPEQIIGRGVGLLLGGKMTFPGLTVRDNLQRRCATPSGTKAPGPGRRSTRPSSCSPPSRPHLHQPAGTLSGGEQQMLALARVMMTKPRLLLIDELALGLAPMVVDRLMEIVREVNAKGTSVVLVEQSVNRAMTLARARRLPRAGRGPLRRPHRRSARTPRPASTGLPRVGRGRPRVALGVDPRLRPGPGRLHRRRSTGSWPWAWCSSTGPTGSSTSPRDSSGWSAAVFLVKCYYDFGFNYWFALILALALAAGHRRAVRAAAAPALRPPAGHGHGRHHRA